LPANFLQRSGVYANESKFVPTTDVINVASRSGWLVALRHGHGLSGAEAVVHRPENNKYPSGNKIQHVTVTLLKSVTRKIFHVLINDRLCLSVRSDSL